jgi:hypothetical protein
VPLTRANVQVFTKAARDEVDAWMGEMVKAGLAEANDADSPNVVWSIRGASRSQNGPTNVALAEKLAALSSEIVVEPVRAIVQPEIPGSRAIAFEQKSAILSGALSFIFGPLGWLYAAPMREAIPAIILTALAQSALFTILPHAWIPLLFTLGNIASGFFGAAYAVRYNQTGRRAPLFTEDTPRLPSGEG